MSTSATEPGCAEPIRLCWGPRCRPRQVLSRRQRRYCSVRCRWDAKNDRRYASAEARAANVRAVQRCRARQRIADPCGRYLTDAATAIVRAYAAAGRRLPRSSVLAVLREVERELQEPDLIRQKVRELVQKARRDMQRECSGRMTSDG